MVRGSSILAGACLSTLLLASTATAAFIPHADLSASSRRLSTRRAVRMNNKDISHLKKYCETVYQTKRRPTRTVWAGKVPIGSEHPIACQTMGTTDTRDVMATVEQAMRVADVGGDLFRITVQGKKEAEACHSIREELFKRGYDIPLVADIHFQPKVALLTAEAVEKIRINPGNFADGAKKFTEINYENEEDFRREVEYIEEVFTPLVEKCKSLGRAMRIGTNHGSLSARILSFYGDTPKGMVETAVGMPFKDIATSDSLFLRHAPPLDDTVGRTALRRLQESGLGVIIPASSLASSPVPNAIAVYDLPSLPPSGPPSLPAEAARYAITLTGKESEEELQKLKQLDPILLLVNIDPALSRVHASRRLMEFIQREGLTFSVIHHYVAQPGETKDHLILRCGSEVGCMLVDGLGDGIMLEAVDHDLGFLRTTAFATLQGSRMRNTKTEFVSCPSCGRTLFDLQETTAEIQKKTGHLPGVAIAVMGCIVNGPGEMADADFGYVGGAPGKVDLYVGKEMVRKGIPNEEACDALVELIKEHDRWVEKSVDEEKPAEKEVVKA
ncbi:4-hydroxy-3-methylbut-2-enyl diphosphate synthase [Nannochloropsis oceanica]